MKNDLIFHDNEWEYICTLLPEDIEETARIQGALVRRRNIQSASVLIRIILAYAVSNLSFKDVAAWASASNLATLRAPSLHHRLKESTSWLECLLGDILKSSSPCAPAGFRFKAVDATVVCGPAAKGSDWRLHVISDPDQGDLLSFELTDRFVGESLCLHDFSKGDVILGDRAYATAKGIFAVRKAEAHVVVRCNPHAIRLCDLNRQVIDLKKRNDDVPKTGALVVDVIIPVPPEKRTKSRKIWSLDKAQAWVPAKVIGGRTAKGDIIWVLSTLNEEVLPPMDVLRAYRFRWQIELLFKRLKSLLNLDELPSKADGPTAKAWILARLLAASLIHKFYDQKVAFSPWGYELRQARL